MNFTNGESVQEEYSQEKQWEIFKKREKERESRKKGKIGEERNAAQIRLPQLGVQLGLRM